jgi:hypothetical protein
VATQEPLVPVQSSAIALNPLPQETGIEIGSAPKLL